MREKAESELMNDNFDVALVYLTEALQFLEPTSEIAYSLLISRATIYYEIGEEAQCIENAEIAHAHFPDYHEASDLQNMCLTKSGYESDEPWSQEDGLDYLEIQDIFQARGIQTWDKGTHTGQCLWEAFVNQLVRCGNYANVPAEPDISGEQWLEQESQKLRMLVVDEIEKNVEIFATDVFGLRPGSQERAQSHFESESELEVYLKDPSGVPQYFLEYIERMRRPGSHADYIGVMTFARMINIPLNVFILRDGRLRLRVYEPTRESLEGLETEGIPIADTCTVLHVALIGRHYMSAFPGPNVQVEDIS